MTRLGGAAHVRLDGARPGGEPKRAGTWHRAGSARGDHRHANRALQGAAGLQEQLAVLDELEGQVRRLGEENRVLRHKQASDARRHMQESKSLSRRCDQLANDVAAANGEVQKREKTVRKRLATRVARTRAADAARLTDSTRAKLC